VVYEATRIKDGEKYAVKKVDKKLIDNMEQLKREINIMTKIDHKNVLKLYDIFEDDTHVYIVMELVIGSELFDRIVDKGNYTEKEAINIIKQILEAIKYLHENEIAHRDLKPENLLCSGEGDDEIVKIADFGLSKMFSSGEQLMTGCGTPGYVAPEVLLCEVYDYKVDLWSIGVITFILLSGYSPFFSDDETELFEKIMTAEFDFDNECWDDVSKLAKDFIIKLLKKNPEKRLDAKQALEHPWLSSEEKTPLDIGKKLKAYNYSRKELAKKFNPNEIDFGYTDSLNHVTQAKGRLKEKTRSQ